MEAFLFYKETHSRITNVLLVERPPCNISQFLLQQHKLFLRLWHLYGCNDYFLADKPLIGRPQRFQHHDELNVKKQWAEKSKMNMAG